MQASANAVALESYYLKKLCDSHMTKYDFAYKQKQPVTDAVQRTLAPCAQDRSPYMAKALQSLQQIDLTSLRSAYMKLNSPRTDITERILSELNFPNNPCWYCHTYVDGPNTDNSRYLSEYGARPNDCENDDMVYVEFIEHMYFVQDIDVLLFGKKIVEYLGIWNKVSLKYAHNLITKAKVCTNLTRWLSQYKSQYGGFLSEQSLDSYGAVDVLVEYFLIIRHLAAVILQRKFRHKTEMRRRNFCSYLSQHIPKVLVDLVMQHLVLSKPTYDYIYLVRRCKFGTWDNTNRRHQKLRWPATMIHHLV